MKRLTLIIVVLLVASSAFAQKKKATPYLMNYKMVSDSSISVPGSRYRPVISTPLYRSNLAKWEQTNKERTEAGEDPIPWRTPVNHNLAVENLKIIGSPHTINTEYPDYEISLDLSEYKITRYMENSLGDYESDDILFEYEYEASLTIKTAKGEVLWAKEIESQYTKKKVKKSDLILSPGVKAMIALAKTQEKKEEAFDFYMTEKQMDHDIRWMAYLSLKYLTEAFATVKYSSNLGMFSIKGKGYDDVNAISEEFMTAYRGFHAISEKKRLSEDDLAAVYKKGITVWEKAINEKGSELEPEALAGLKLNCAVAYTWIGEYDKARKYLEEVEANFEPIGGAIYTEEWAIAPAMMNMNGYKSEAMELYLNFSSGRDRVTIDQ